MKYFGTDGIRGKSEFFSAEFLKKLSSGIFRYLSTLNTTNLSVIIGYDPRLSSPDISETLTNELTALGIKVYNANMVATPVLAFLTKKFMCDIGIMISASHNPPEYNGIKFFNKFGSKLKDEEYLEKCIDKSDVTHKINLNSPTTHQSITDELYIDYVAKATKIDLTDLNVCLDTANGATSHVAPKIFKKLGANVRQINSETDGKNINKNCGATHIEAILNEVLPNEIGLTYDGDGDRVMAVINGELYDGDKIMYVLAKNGYCKGKMIVGTIMTNLGLEKALENIGTGLIRANVGDKYVYEKMLEKNLNLGGETSGHIILRDYLETGDGLMASVVFASIAKAKSLKNLSDGHIEYPQIHNNIKPSDSITEADIKKFKSLPSIKGIVENINTELNKMDMRAVIRPSGTEPIIRVMVEGKDENKCKSEASRIKKLIEKELCGG